jgi:hypothetical protein
MKRDRQLGGSWAERSVISTYQFPAGLHRKVGRGVDPRSRPGRGRRQVLGDATTGGPELDEVGHEFIQKGFQPLLMLERKVLSDYWVTVK